MTLAARHVSPKDAYPLGMKKRQPPRGRIICVCMFHKGRKEAMGNCSAGGDFGGCDGLLAFGKWNAAAGTGNAKGTFVWPPAMTSASLFGTIRLAGGARNHWKFGMWRFQIHLTRCTQYNTLQKQQGFNLEPLARKVCRQWVYRR